jgi:replicative DNA helicase
MTRFGDSRVEQLRIPPQSIDAEQAVIGGLMLAPDAFDRIADRLNEEDFYRRDHQLIYRAIRELAEKSRPYDAVTLGEWFESQGLSEQVAGGAYLVELASTTPSAANIVAYAEIVREKAIRRRLIDIGTNIVNEAFEPSGRPSVELVGNASTQVGGLLSSEPCDLESVVPVMQRVFDILQDRYQRGGGIQGISTGISAEFDELINGLSPGLIILAARPKMGKTTLAQNVAEHVAVKLQKAVAVFSMEMQAEALVERMLSSQGDISASALRLGRLDDDDWARASDTIRGMRNAPLYISRPRNARVEHIIAQAKRQHAKTPLGLIVIDYLQLIQTSGDNRAQGLGEVTRSLVLLAHEIGVPVMLLSQLNRDLERRVDKRPIPADLRDSGAIEQDADIVIFIYDDEAYYPDSKHAGTAELIVALQRNGPSGMVRVLRRKDRFRFEQLPEFWEPQQRMESIPGPASAPRKLGHGRRKNAASPRDAAAGE